MILKGNVSKTVTIDWLFVGVLTDIRCRYEYKIACKAIKHCRAISEAN